MTHVKELSDQISSELHKAIKGKNQAKAILIATFLAQGNVLLEGAPGLGKTLLARSMAKILGFKFSRIQFTPDLLPSDILGTNIYNQGKAVFEFIPGPIFANFILADEINRAPAKTQSALLEVMEERQVTVDNKTYSVDENFIVFATQNPLEFEGTYTLPEAQVDRFMVRIRMDYPTDGEELEIISMACGSERDFTAGLNSVDDAESRVREAREQIVSVVVDDKIIKYVRDLIRASRTLDEIELGNSPRAGQMIIRLAKAYAAVTGASYVNPDHIRELAPVVFPHRWVLKPESQVQRIQESDILTNLFNLVQVPTL
jgi:MoxR-like ATPase